MSLLVFACIQVPPPPRCRRRRRRPLGFFFFFFFCFLRRSGQPPSPHFQVPIDVGHRLGPRVHLSNLMRVIQKETSSLLPFFTLGIWLGPTRHLQDTYVDIVPRPRQRGNLGPSATFKSLIFLGPDLGPTNRPLVNAFLASLPICYSFVLSGLLTLTI